MNQTIFISNLHPLETQGNIQTIFSQFAPLSLCHVFMDKDRCRGFGLITFQYLPDKIKALNRSFVSMGKVIKTQEYISDDDTLTALDSAQGSLKICVLGVPK
jgi:RNA recognition motif-containing protein